jgi:Ca2+-binding RTX toxin-like protein
MAAFQYFAGVDPLTEWVPGNAWNLTQLTSTTMVWESGDHRLVVSGTGFKVGPPAAGTITGMKLYQTDPGSGGAGQVLLAQSTSGLSLGFAGLLDLLAEDSDQFAVPVYLFKGNDVITGSAGDDAIWGYAGNDSISGGAGNDDLSGDSYASDVPAGKDTLVGGDGKDTLDGGGGADSLVGGGGDDLYYVGDPGDVVVEAAGGGAHDRVVFSNERGLASYTLPTQVENLDVLNTRALSAATTMTATGNALANKITVVEPWVSPQLAMKLYGLGGNDRLVALDGKDTLDGGSGNDTMIGGRGSDTYFVDAVADAVREQVSLGGVTVDVDTVVYGVASAGTVSLGGTVSGLANTVSYSGVENLRLGASSGTLAHKGVGSAAANALTGNAAANALYGLGGNDTLDGGAGVDTMVGGSGNDRYVVERSTDVVKELSGEGADTVTAGLSLTLAANVEHLILTGSGAIGGTGNAGHNALTGNGAANTLRGLGGNDTLDGGAGADKLIGGAGNDQYVIDQAGDTITELAGEGTDSVTSPIAYTLSSALENLTLVGSAGVAGTGNAGNNRLVGNGQGSVLSGLGGNDTLSSSSAGIYADTLAGGAGDDTYLLEWAYHPVIEQAGQGTDTVQFSKDFHASTYTLLPNVENGTKALDSDSGFALRGNDGDNVLRGSTLGERLDGGAGNDTLIGRGGYEGLYGGTGEDSFRFSGPLGGANVVYLGDFYAMDDRIELDDAVFVGIGPVGALAAGAFRAGAAAQDTSDRIVYDASTGNLYFDADGNGSGTAILFAGVDAGTPIAFDDFFVV